MDEPADKLSVPMGLLKNQHILRSSTKKTLKQLQQQNIPII